MKYLIVIVCILLLVCSPLALLLHPALYTPLVEALLNMLLAFFTTFAGYLFATDSAKQSANDKWLPQGENQCRDLQAMWLDVRRLSLEVSDMCSLVADIPEFQQKNMVGVRSALNGRCQGNAHTLDSLAVRLENAVAAWKNFLFKNCSGDECKRISDRLDGHQAALAAQLKTLPCASTPSIT